MFVIILLASIAVALILLVYDIGKNGATDYTFYDEEPDKSMTHSKTRNKDAE